MRHLTRLSDARYCSRDKAAPAPTKPSDLLEALRESAGMGSRREPKRAAAKADGTPKAKRRTARSKRAA